VHSQNLIHGDLRGSNILVTDDWHMALCDFGLTTFSDATAMTQTSTGRGSTRWMAPELLDPDHPQHGKRTFASDVYSFACVCIELYTLNHPFPNLRADPAVVTQVIFGKRPSRPNGQPEGWAMLDYLWSLVEKCWDQDASKRPRMSDVVHTITFQEDLLEP